MTDHTEDPFSSLHNLEEDFYQSGYSLGVTDGARAGRIEGRAFGLQKGFEKFVDLGKLAGRSNVWVERLPKGNHRTEDIAEGNQRPKHAASSGSAGEQSRTFNDEDSRKALLHHLPANERLQKHVQTMWALVEPATFSTQNTEEAIADFDDRFKRATAKAKVIEKIVGELPIEGSMSDEDGLSGKRGEIKVSREQRAEKNIEDFGALVKP